MRPSVPSRRSTQRLALECPVELARRSGAAIGCRTVDLSEGGMSVVSERPLALDEVLHFDLELEGDHVEGEARVLREGAYRRYALRFEALVDETAAALGRRLETLRASSRPH